jgi:hypothetical protein
MSAAHKMASTSANKATMSGSTRTNFGSALSMLLLFAGATTASTSVIAIIPTRTHRPIRR